MKEKSPHRGKCRCSPWLSLHPSALACRERRHPEAKELPPTAPSQEHPHAAGPDLWTDTGAAEVGVSGGGVSCTGSVSTHLSGSAGLAFAPAQDPSLTKRRVRTSLRVSVLAPQPECAGSDSFLQITQV